MWSASVIKIVTSLLQLGPSPPRDAKLWYAVSAPSIQNSLSNGRNSLRIVSHPLLTGVSPQSLLLFGSGKWYGDGVESLADSRQGVQVRLLQTVHRYWWTHVCLGHCFLSGLFQLLLFLYGHR
jgi:hypothetical protein